MGAVKLWIVVGGGGKPMLSGGWSCVVVGGGNKIMAGRGWLHDLVRPIKTHLL